MLFVVYLAGEDVFGGIFRLDFSLCTYTSNICLLEVQILAMHDIVNQKPKYLHFGLVFDKMTYYAKGNLFYQN